MFSRDMFGFLADNEVLVADVRLSTLPLFVDYSCPSGLSSLNNGLEVKSAAPSGSSVRGYCRRYNRSIALLTSQELSPPSLHYLGLSSAYVSRDVNAVAFARCHKSEALHDMNGGDLISS